MDVVIRILKPCIGYLHIASCRIFSKQGLWEYEFGICPCKFMTVMVDVNVLQLVILTKEVDWFRIFEIGIASLRNYKIRT